MKVQIFIALMALIVPGSLFASTVEITEIFYDAEGSDTDREWVEIYNGSGKDVEIESLRFLEGDTHHTLKSDTTTLASGAYAILVSKPDSFLALHPGFSGILIDTSFSLHNEGETLAITDNDKNVLSQVSYTKRWVQAGTGSHCRA